MPISEARRAYVQAYRKSSPKHKLQKKLWHVKKDVGPAAVHYKFHLSRLKEIYAAVPDGMTVDHVIPIRGKLVCGLHVPQNLQYLTAEDNAAKSNKFKVI